MKKRKLRQSIKDWLMLIGVLLGGLVVGLLFAVLFCLAAMNY